MESHTTSAALKVRFRPCQSWDSKSQVLCYGIEFRLTDESAIHAIEAWRRIKHCNIVGLKEAFTNKAFGDDCALFCFVSLI